MNNTFISTFEEMNSINTSLYMRETKIIKITSIIDYLKGDTSINIESPEDLKSIKYYYSKLKKLQKEQKKELLKYDNIHSQFIGYINDCDVMELQFYAKKLTESEKRIKNNYMVLAATSGNELEVQRLKVIAKCYYDSIESIYRYIDYKLKNSFRLLDEDIPELKKTIK